MIKPRAFMAIIALPLLSACATGGVDVWGGTASDVSVEAFRFRVIHTFDRAEAYRVGLAFRADAPAVFAEAVLAMERASGCEVVASTLSGDIALIEADLAC